ncbi:MAG: ABC transporter ATP-binding protein [Inquilinaceae bacterium]
MNAAAIDVRGLSKSFGGKSVVRDFSLRVDEGQIFGFLGPNGSGKTTTIRMMCGLLTPDSGQGTCLGFDILRQSADIKRHVGYMTQRFSLYEDLSIAENLTFIARMYGVPRRRQAVDRALEELGLTDRRRQLARHLSGGWKQRLALAACMIHAPRLLLLDEPTAGVDPKARRDFWDQIHRLAKNGITVLVSTHYMDEAARCHALAYLAYGKLLIRGTGPEVVAQSGLATWLVDGDGLSGLADALDGQKGIDMVVPFGATLHVSGRDAEALDRATSSYRDTPGQRWRRGEPGLEDVFILLMDEVRRASPEPAP